MLSVEGQAEKCSIKYHVQYQHSKCYAKNYGGAYNNVTVLEADLLSLY